MDKVKLRSFHINISSNDVGSYLETNTLSDFSSKLAIPLHFPPNEKWTVSLINMTLPNIERNEMQQDIVYFSSPKMKSQTKIAKIEAGIAKQIRKSTRVFPTEDKDVEDQAQAVIQRFRFIIKNPTPANNIHSNNDESDDDAPPKKRVAREAEKEFVLKHFSNNALFQDFILSRSIFPNIYTSSFFNEFFELEVYNELINQKESKAINSGFKIEIFSDVIKTALYDILPKPDEIKIYAIIKYGQTSIRDILKTMLKSISDYVKKQVPDIDELILIEALKMFAAVFIFALSDKSQLLSGKNHAIGKDTYKNIVLYANIISNWAYCNQYSKVLYSFTKNIESRERFFEVKNPVSNLIEKSHIDQITICVRDGFGEKINFENSYIGTNLLLRFDLVE